MFYNLRCIEMAPLNYNISESQRFRGVPVQVVRNTMRLRKDPSVKDKYPSARSKAFTDPCSFESSISQKNQEAHFGQIGQGVIRTLYLGW